MNFPDLSRLNLIPTESLDRLGVAILSGSDLYLCRQLAIRLGRYPVEEWEKILQAFESSEVVGTVIVAADASQRLIAVGPDGFRERPTGPKVFFSRVRKRPEEVADAARVEEDGDGE